MRLVANISDVIKNDDSKKELKDMLIKYSVVIVYKMSNFMKDEVEIKMNEYKLLQDDLVRMGKVKLEMYKKITEIKTSIQEQNNQLTTIASKINNPVEYMYGGESDFTRSGKTKSTEKLISLASESSDHNESTSSSDSERSKSLSNSDSSESKSGSELITTSKLSSARKKSDLFSNSDCYFTESGDEVNINYLSTTDQQNSKSVISEIQSIKRAKI